ncbi:MAG TPA: hypothetical protein VKV27_00555 [Solirubrobacteraceae bacterium]|nr:hypothetical protein [Solirubrobacteraceae bacterium]
MKMELAGLEPATSWVRSRRPGALNRARLRAFRGRGTLVGGLGLRPLCAHFGWDRAKGKWLWPDLSPASAPVKDAVTSQPIGRLGRGDDIAAPGLWLCTAAASLVVGVALPADGGYTAR